MLWTLAGKTTTVDDGGMLYTDNDNKPSQSDHGGITTSSVNTSNPVGVSVSAEVVKVSGESVIQVPNDDDDKFPPEKGSKESNEVIQSPLSEKETKETNEGNSNFPPSSEKETKGTNDQDMDDKHQKQPVRYFF